MAFSTHRVTIPAAEAVKILDVSEFSHGASLVLVPAASIVVLSDPALARTEGITVDAGVPFEGDFHDDVYAIATSLDTETTAQVAVTS